MLDSTDTKVRYLLELGTDQISHSGSTLIKHLVGVHDIFVANRAPQYFCDAGLFHSIYGTPAFTHQSTDDRSTVRDLIGPEAERLVY